MRRIFWSGLILALLASFLPIAPSSPAGLTSVALAQSLEDDEIILLRNDGLIYVDDPYTPPGIRPVVWQSPSAGWVDIATGDFNGDGTAEIVAIRGGEMTVFDPVVPAGGIPVSFNVNVSGETWQHVVTGDIDNDGQDEIIAQRTTSEGNIRTRIQVYDPNPTATSWTLVRNEGYGQPWRKLATGDVNGDGADDVAAIRYVSSPRDNRLTIWSPATGWSLLHDQGDYAGDWLNIKIGNVEAEAGARQELAMSRGGVVTDLNSYYLRRWTGGQNIEDLDGRKFFPYFFDIALGDVNLSGDDEVFLLRDTGGQRVDLIGINYGSDPFAPFETLVGQGSWKRVNTGRLDSSNPWGQVVVLKTSEYRIYTRPHANTNFTQKFGSYISSGNFAIANLDGPGIPLGPALAVSPASVELTLEIGQSGSQTIAVTNSGDGSVIDWSASVTSNSPWLSVAPSSGVTPGQFQINIQTNNLLAGTYNGVVRVSSSANLTNGPQDIPVTLVATAPQFSVSPTYLQWFYRLGANSGTQTVRVSGAGVNWHAGVVPMGSAAALVKALEAGADLQVKEGGFVLDKGTGPETVPVIDWVDITPSRGTAIASGSPVLISLVADRVPWGVSNVALVFVADSVASPRAVVVDMRVQAYLSRNDLHFLPLVNAR